MDCIDRSLDLYNTLLPNERFGILNTVQEVQQDFQGCRLCWAISSQGRRYPDNSIIFSTDDCHLIPALGALRAGYVLFVSQQHIGSTATLPIAQIQKIESQLNEVLHKLKTNFPKFKWIAFEHGTTVQNGIKACCVDHLHFHILPYEFNLTKELETRLSSVPMQINSLTELPEILNNDPKNYILVKSDDNDLNLFLPQVYSSQYVRQIIANQLGLRDQWNWMEYPLIRTCLATLKMLRGKKIAQNAIYYAHPIEGLSQTEIKNDIDRIQGCISAKLNNTRLDSMFNVLDESVTSKIGITKDLYPSFLVESEIRYLLSCDLMLVNLSKQKWQYVGALMEIVYAALGKLPIIAIVGQSSLQKRQWLKVHADYLVQDIEQAIPLIETFFK